MTAIQVLYREELDHGRAIRLWLYAVAALVFVMVLIGGATRLTESGLSITEWQPVTGVLPPTNDAQWLSEFQKYQAIPQYSQLNANHWPGFLCALRLVSVARLDPPAPSHRSVDHPRFRCAGMSLADFKTIYWWEWVASGRHWVVDGGFRPRRSRRSVTISIGHASRPRLYDLCRAGMDRTAVGG
jgi:hypothetical protein